MTLFVTYRAQYSVVRQRCEVRYLRGIRCRIRTAWPRVKSLSMLAGQLQKYDEGMHLEQECSYEVWSPTNAKKGKRYLCP